MSSVTPLSPKVVIRRLTGPELRIDTNASMGFCHRPSSPRCGRSCVCHRVIASDGRLQGYAGGLSLKAKLLAMEQSRPAQGLLL